MTRYKKGDVVTGVVTGIEKYGIFVGLDDYNSGLIHISEILIHLLEILQIMLK